MQNGAFPWVSPSLASATQKSPWPGYQASLTDLFLKKNPLQFATSGISQLAAASSYLEKMSTLTAAPNTLNTSANSPGPLAGPSTGSPSDILITHSNHPHSGISSHKCPHPDNKDKSYPCDICQQYSSVSVSTALNKSLDVVTTSCSTRMNPNESMEHKPPHFSAVPPGHLHPHPHPAHLHPSAAVPGLPHHHHHHHHHQAQRRASAQSGSSTMSRNRNPTNNKQFLCPVCHKLFTQKGITPLSLSLSLYICYFWLNVCSD